MCKKVTPQTVAGFLICSLSQGVLRLVLQTSDLLNSIKTSFDSYSKQLLKLPQVTILWFHLHLKAAPHQPSVGLLCTSFTYSIRWLSRCETLISSKQHPVDLPNWVNQRWSMETQWGEQEISVWWRFCNSLHRPLQMNTQRLVNIMMWASD